MTEKPNLVCPIPYPRRFDIEVKAAKQTQKIDNGIEAQKRVFEITVEQWSKLHSALSAKHLLSPKEIGVLNIAMQMPVKIPTERQCIILLETVEKASSEGITTV